MLSKARLTVLGACMTAFASTSSAFIVDGIVGPTDNYTESYIMPTEIESGGIANAVLRLGVGDSTTGERDGSGNLEQRLFMLFEIPTEVHDLTFGANTAPGWEGQTAEAFKTKGKKKDKKDKKGKDKKKGKNIHTVGSENIQFEFNGEDVKLKMSPEEDGGSLIGYKLEDDAGGAVRSVSTSLDYNIKQGYLSESIVDSPGESGNPCQTSEHISGDAACYAYLDANYSDYEYKQLYEFEIAAPSGFFSSYSSLLDIAQYISGAQVHASPPKSGDNHDFVFDCLNKPTPDCEELPDDPEDPPTSVSEPAPIGVLVLGLALLGLRRKFK